MDLLEIPSKREHDFLAGGGEMGKVIREKEWSKTPLGAIETWPQSLRTAVSLCVASNFPISMAWGPGRVQIYNDGYWPICAAKHPHSMGQDYKECWFSAWPVIGEAFERAWKGAPSYIENQRMFLDRNGYLEETFFTFSFSPIRDETGGVGGLFHPVTETTARMLSERRTRALRDLSARGMKAKTVEECGSLAAHLLGDHELDLPFVIIYLLEGAGQVARLVGVSGIGPQTLLSPDLVDLSAKEAVDAAWPLAAVAKSGQRIIVGDVDRRFPSISCGPYPESVKSALVLPILRPGTDRQAGVLVAGVSPRLPLDDAYLAFYDLLAGHLATAFASSRAYEEERERAEKLAELDRAKTAFFSNVSHEFRTPLTLILGPLEDMLAKSPEASTERVQLDTAYRNSLRLLKLVNSLLDFSRIEAGRVRAVFQATDLALLTEDLASTYRSTIEKAGLRFVVDCPALEEAVYVDREMWEKIVLNLISNAFKFTFEGGITVALQPKEDSVELSVRDTGTGIAESELPRVFERFHRVEGARGRTFEGTGIGLALVQDLVKLHAGHVLVESELDKGTRFTVKIPFGVDHLPAERIEEGNRLPAATTRADVFVEEARRWVSRDVDREIKAPQSPSFPHQLQPGRRYVLVADDNADMRDYVSRLLAPHYEVIAVNDGLAALEVVQGRRPDLVLTDVMMPGLHGFELLARLRSDPSTATIPVIMLSARAGEEARVEGLDAGADDYLAKPFSAPELLARVSSHLKLTHLREESARRETELERMNLLHQITRAIGERQDLRSIFQIVTRNLEDQLAVDLCCICLYDRLANTLTISNVGLKSSKLATELALTEQVGIPIDQNGLSQCMTGQLVYEPNITAVATPFLQKLVLGGLRSFVAAPLLVENEVFGALLVARQQPEGFASGECEFLHQLSEHVALAAHQAQLYGTLQQAYDDLRTTQQAVMQQERLRALGQMASGIAHDINNAITPVLLYTESLLEKEPNLSAKARDYLRIIQRAIDDVSQTIARMREFYRQRQPQNTLTPVAVNEMVQHAIDLTRARWSDMPQQRGIVIEMKTELSPDVPAIMGIESEIREALVNLIFNAVDAMAEGGTVTLRTRVGGSAAASDKGDSVRVEVSDTGVGMDEGTRRRCMEPFFTTKGERGTGLGLAMVFGVVQRHNAELEIESAPGKGTTVGLSFPVPSAVAGSIQSEFRVERLTGLRILVVDDDPLLLKALQDTLETDGHVVSTANSGQGGIDAFHACRGGPEQFSVVITDLGMPHVDGRRVAAAVKDASPSTPVILLTGWGQRLAAENDLPRHVNCVVGKPPKLRELRDAIAQVCGSGKKTPPRPFLTASR